MNKFTKHRAGEQLYSDCQVSIVHKIKQTLMHVLTYEHHAVPWRNRAVKVQWGACAQNIETNLFKRLLEYVLHCL